MRTLALLPALVICATTQLHAESNDAPLKQLIDSFADLSKLDYSNSLAPALKDLQQWHDATPEETVQVTWTKKPSVHAQNRIRLRFIDGRRMSHHFVYSWAIQGGDAVYLRLERLAAIKALLAELPDGIESVEDTADLVMISFNHNGQSRVFAYQRTKLPPVVMRLCLLGDIDIDIAPVEIGKRRSFPGPTQIRK